MIVFSTLFALYIQLEAPLEGAVALRIPHSINCWLEILVLNILGYLQCFKCPILINNSPKHSVSQENPNREGGLECGGFGRGF